MRSRRANGMNQVLSMRRTVFPPSIRFIFAASSVCLTGNSVFMRNP